MFDGNRLQVSRIQRGLTQSQLGKAIGQDQAYISRLERGRYTEITVKTLERLATVLHVRADDLLHRAETRE